jgi:hypothetical protein
MQTLYWIEDSDGLKTKFRPNWEQRTLYNRLHNLNAILKARKHGISTFIELLILDLCEFNSNLTCGIVDKTEDDAKKKMAKIQFAYDHLDDPDDSATCALGAAIKQANPMTISNKTEIIFANNSKIWVGTDLRGSDVQVLHLSELGYIAFYYPEKAQKICSGALNAVAAGNMVFAESTHEGGKYGANYDLMKGAMESHEPLTTMDWRFHFFPWHADTDKVLPLEGPLTLSADDRKYFDDLEKQREDWPGGTGQHIVLTPEQKHWYIKKRATPKMNMKKEFPSTVDECFESDVEGAIYGSEMTKLRAAGRIIDFQHNPASPLFTFWDIGNSDDTAIWLVQFCGLDICALAYYANSGEIPAFYAAKVVEWERKYAQPIRMHYLPHDASRRIIGQKTYIDFLEEAGITAVERVEMTPRVWVGINELRAMLPKFFFHKSGCDAPMAGDGMAKPSGLACIENYHKRTQLNNGLVSEEPVHDIHSHGADALRVMAEAKLRGLLNIGTAEVIQETRRSLRHEPLRSKAAKRYSIA